MRSAVPAATIEIRIIYILVMGLTGAGKSTFISVVTENDQIPIGRPGVLSGGT
jgi:ABC-type proline/glycine betaine transport system ATPase subunit